MWAVARAGDAWIDEVAGILASLRPAPQDACAGVPVGPADDPGPASTPTWRHDDDAYLALIRSCQESIRRGDAYQLCLTNTARIPGRVDPVRALRVD